MTTFPVVTLSALWLRLEEKPTSPASAKLFSHFGAGQHGTRSYYYHLHITSGPQHQPVTHPAPHPKALHPFSFTHTTTSPHAKQESTIALCLIFSAIFHCQGRVKWIETASFFFFSFLQFFLAQRDYWWNEFVYICLHFFCIICAVYVWVVKLPSWLRKSTENKNPISGQFYEQAFLEAAVFYNFASCTVHFPDIRQNVLVVVLQPPSVESKAVCVTLL